MDSMNHCNCTKVLLGIVIDVNVHRATYSLKRTLDQERPQISNKRHKVILLHDNARRCNNREANVVGARMGSPFPLCVFSRLRFHWTTTFSGQCSTYWKVHTSQISKKCKNSPMNGSIRKINRFIVATSISCQRNSQRL